MQLHGLVDLEPTVTHRVDLVAISDRFDVPGIAARRGHKWGDRYRSGVIGQTRRSASSARASHCSSV